MANGKTKPKLNRKTGTPKPRTPPKLNRTTGQPGQRTPPKLNRVTGEQKSLDRTPAEVKPGTKPPTKEYNWLGLEKGDGKSQDQVVEGLDNASKVMGTMAAKHASANSGLTGGTEGVGKGAAVSSSGVVRDEDYQGYTEKKKKYGLT